MHLLATVTFLHLNKKLVYPPEFDPKECPPDCSKPCEKVCPADAISLGHIVVDEHTQSDGKLKVSIGLVIFFVFCLFSS